MDNISLEKIIKCEDVDQNLILDVPESIGLKIINLIQNGDTESQNLLLELLQDMNDQMTLDESRKLIMKVEGELHPATLLDFPCVIESQKTMDYKTFYKAGDISQMLYVHEAKIDRIEEIRDFNPFKAKDTVFNNIVWLNDPDHKFKLKHGLTKSTRDIRSKRFKAKQRYDKEELGVVCKRLKEIIDNGAAKFEKNLLKGYDETSKLGDNQSVASNLLKSHCGEDSELKQSATKQSAKISIPANPNTSLISKGSVTKVSSNSNSKKQRQPMIKIKNSASKIQIPSNIQQEELPLREEELKITSYQEQKEASNGQKNQANTSVADINNEEIPDKEELIQQYRTFKKDYDELKLLIESNPHDTEKAKHKKKLKKHLKHLKSIIQGGIRENDDESNN